MNNRSAYSVIPTSLETSGSLISSTQRSYNKVTKRESKDTVQKKTPIPRVKKTTSVKTSKDGDTSLSDDSSLSIDEELNKLTPVKEAFCEENNIFNAIILNNAVDFIKNLNKFKDKGSSIYFYWTSEGLYIGVYNVKDSVVNFFFFKHDKAQRYKFSGHNTYYYMPTTALSNLITALTSDSVLLIHDRESDAKKSTEYASPRELETAEEIVFTVISTSTKTVAQSSFVISYDRDTCGRINPEIFSNECIIQDQVIMYPLNGEYVSLPDRLAHLVLARGSSKNIWDISSFLSIDTSLTIIKMIFEKTQNKRCEIIYNPDKNTYKLCVIMGTNNLSTDLINENRLNDDLDLMEKLQNPLSFTVNAVTVSILTYLKRKDTKRTLYVSCKEPNFVKMEVDKEDHTTTCILNARLDNRVATPAETPIITKKSSSRQKKEDTEKKKVTRRKKTAKPADIYSTDE